MVTGAPTVAVMTWALSLAPDVTPALVSVSARRLSLGSTAIRAKTDITG